MFDGLFSPTHLLVFGFVALLLFGHRLPSVMRSLGQGVVEFKKGLRGIEDEVNKSSAGKIEEQPARQLKEEAKPAEAEPAAK
jgi:sec-independent protein translocase protein TatA